MYKNPPTVVVGLIPVMFDNGTHLLGIKRALEDGYGKFALPGGYQVEGESWRDALSREVFEETGFGINSSNWYPVDVVTVENGKINLVFAECPPIAAPNDVTFPHKFDGGGETLEVDVVTIWSCFYNTGKFAFPAHAEQARSWFTRRHMKFVEEFKERIKDDNCNCGTAKC